MGRCAHARSLARWVVVAIAVLLPGRAWAQPLAGGEGGGSLLLLLGAISLLPFLLVMITSYAKIAVVLHILRSALGSPHLPPTIVITGLTLVLSGMIMAPTGLKVYLAARPVLEAPVPGETDWQTGAKLLSAAHEPVLEFLRRNSREADRERFRGLVEQLARRGGETGTVERDSILAALPAFVIGQLTAAFQIGFLLFMPFLVLDLLVANVLLALGLHAVSPATIALPLKLLLFVMADGWSLLAQGLILSYG